MSKKYIYPSLLLIVSVLFLAFATLLFFRRYEKLRNGGDFRTHQARVSMVNTDQIQVWMTFDFINRSFKLPSDYLKNELNITSKKYPKVTVGRVAASQGIAPNDFIAKVQSSIERYVVLIRNPQE